MTNNELQAIFIAAEEASENIFDIYEFLTKYEEQYKQSNFSKIKPSIYDAYELYYSHKNKAEEIISSILNADYTKLIEQFSLESLVNQIPEEFRPFLSQLIEEQF
jgi:hypothetical protein